MIDFGGFLRALGLRPRTIAPDGRWRRCGTDEKPKSYNGAYKLAVDGQIGWGKDWARMTEAATWRPDDRAEQAPTFDREAFRRAEAEARGARIRAQEAALMFWSGCKDFRAPHPYLEAKGLDASGCSHLRVDSEGWLVIPAFINGRLVSLQRIAPDGTKRFWRGAPVAGSSYEIRRRAPAVTVLCEGLATGLACYQALPDSRVIVAWNAGNLASTPERPKGMVVIAADNDHGTEERLGNNPGIDAARKAAETLGCGVAFPARIEGTDWCDYRNERVAKREATKYRETSGQIRRSVDAEIANELMRAARWVR